MATTPVEVKKAAAPAPAVPDAWRSLRTEMDRLFDRFASGFGMPSLSRLFDGPPALRFESSFIMPAPAMDVTEDKDAYKLTAELPGMSEKDIEVSVTDSMLTLKGEKKQETEHKAKNYHVSERSYGSFDRSFSLPDGIDANKIAANFAKGVLTITLPKRPEAKVEPKKVEVKPG
jgi:HSP20 family protein